MMFWLGFFVGLGVASVVALLAWTFMSSVRDLREEDAARAAETSSDEEADR